MDRTDAGCHVSPPPPGRDGPQRQDRPGDLPDGRDEFLATGFTVRPATKSLIDDLQSEGGMRSASLHVPQVAEKDTPQSLDAPWLE